MAVSNDMNSETNLCHKDTPRVVIIPVNDTQNGADMIVKLFSFNGRLMRKIDVPAGPGLKEFRVGTEFLNSGCYLAEISLTNGITPAVKQRFLK